MGVEAWLAVAQETAQREADMVGSVLGEAGLKPGGAQAMSEYFVRVLTGLPWAWRPGRP